MIRFALFNACFLFLAVSQHLAVAQEIIYKNVPNWVTVIEYPSESPVSKYDVTSGVYYKLVDYQTNFEKESTYFHFVQNIVSSAGVTNASQLTIPFDTAYQQLIFHKMTIWRNGNAIEKTNETTFEYVKNEQELHSNIYTGLVTALAVIKDLRKNDFLEIAYTLKGINPIYDGAQYRLMPLEDVNPIDKIFVRMVYPSNENYTYQCKGCDEGEIIERKTGGVSELVIERNNTDALELEETLPPWIIPYDYVEVSSTQSWGEVVDWAANIFQQSEDHLTEKVFGEIFYPEYDTEDKINAIIDFVQDEIRYMGIESGIGSIKPFSPNQTIKQRFGDCKDKSLLMVAMLRKIGVEESYLAFVNSTMLKNVTQLLPSGYSFDHCIVKFNFNGNNYWIDPTQSHQGGSFKNMITFDFEKALVIKNGTTDLTAMNVFDSVSVNTACEELDISSYNAPATLKVKTKFNGARADYIRQILEHYSRKELAEAFKNPYGLIFPSIQESQKLTIKEDEIDNIIETEENYTIANIWQDDLKLLDGKRTLTYEPVNLYNYIYALSCESKKYPVYFVYPSRFEQKTIIKLPSAFELDYEDLSVENVAFKYSRKSTMIDEKTIELAYEFESKVKEIAPRDFPKICEQMNEIANNMGIMFTFPKFTFDFNSLLRNLDTTSSNMKSFPVNSPMFLFKDSTLNDLNGQSVKDSEFLVVDQQPEYPGGMTALYKDISKNLKYPKKAKKLGVSGKVFVSFVVRKTGELESIKIVKGIGAGCDEEVIRIMEKLKRWKPGYKDEKAVDVTMILPITFKL